MNVNKDYGIRDSETDNFFTASVVGTLNINATADLAISIDIRSETSLLDVNLTDGANLYINLLKIQTTATTVGVNIQNDLSDGMILFDKNMVASDFTYVGLDEDGSKIFNLGVKKGTKTQTFKITFDDGVDTSNLTWDDTLVDGYYALYSVSAVPEPAEWAMIFGALALALGLAVYKRRK